jgi:hypothetical protein
MRDDDEEGRGPSGWAWFQLGRMAADNERHTSQTVSRLLHARRTASLQQELEAQIHALAAENARLRQELADYQRNYSKLDAWARRAEQQIAQLLKDRGE